MEMASVFAVLKPTTNELDKLTRAAIRAGVSTQWSPIQAAQGLKELSTAGFTATESHQALIPVLDLATGSLGQLGVGGAAEVAASAIRGFAFDISETTRVVDVLLKATLLTNIQARDLRVMLAYVAGSAKSAGQEFEHIVTVLGALRNTGQEASVAATTLRSALLAMTAPKARKEFEKLNVALFDNLGNFRDFADVVFDLENVLGKATERERQLSLQAIFGQRGLNAYNSVVAMGVEKFKQLESELKTASGMAAYFRKKMLEPLIGRFLLLIGAIKTLAIQLGTPLLGPLKILTTTLWHITRFIIYITQTFPLMTKFIVLTVASATATTVLIGSLLLLGGILGILNARYMLLAGAKLAYFLISSLILGVEGWTRRELMLSLIAERFKLTQTQLINLETKKRLFLERLLGIGISTNTSITYTSVAAAWQERIARLGNNVALAISNALRWVSNKLLGWNTKAIINNTRATIASSAAFRFASAGAGIFIGALKGIKVAMMANPILLLATLVIAGVIAFYSLSKAFWNAEGAAKGLYAFLLFTLFPAFAPIIFAIKAISSAWKQNVGGIKDTFIIMKNAIKGIFTPIGRLFSSMDKGSGKLNILFKSIMKLFFIPLKKGFEGIARVATIAGAVIEIVVQEIERLATPMAPAIEELSKAFDELSLSVFGPGKTNLSFWQRFGESIRIIVRVTLVPMLQIVTLLAKATSFLAKNLQTAYSIFTKLAPISTLAPAGGPKPAFAKAFRAAIGPLGGLFLQKGGITKQGSPVNAVIGEGSREVIQPLPSGMRPSDLKMIYDLAKVSAIGKRKERVIIENRIFLDGQEIIRFQNEAKELEDLRGYNYGVA
jgi:TP901 family phage tail tape measure protein